MAIGDAAAAAGIDLVSGSEQANTLDTEENKTRDYIAQFAAWSKISGKPASFTPAAHSHSWDSITGKPSSFAPASHSHSWDSITGKPSSFTPASHSHAWSAITGKPSTFTPSSHNHSASQITSGTLNSDRIPNLNASKITGGTITRPVSTSGGGRFGAAWDNNITSTRRAVWMESDGTLGHTASSARYKKDIVPWAEMSEDEQFAALEVVSFRWRKAYADPANPDAVEVGMIAETLHDLGWTFAVFYEPDSFGVLRPEGIHYDRLVLLVIPYLQRIGARVAALEARLNALEGANA